MVSQSIISAKNTECPHCFEDEGIEYVIHAQTYHCNSCTANWHELALYELHYFSDGRMCKIEKGVCVETGHTAFNG